jgi:hypothetical protein
MVETHLVQCRSCRVLVVALREEASLLADVLHERERPSFRRAPRAAAPPRELAVSLVPPLALGVVALTVLGWLLESALPRGIERLNPFRPQGAHEMAFDLLFLMRDRVPGLLAFAATSASLACVSLLLAFAVSAVSRRFSGSIALGLAVAGVMASAAPSSALDLYLRADEVAVPGR